MKKQEDYLDDNIPEGIKEVLQTRGVHREILEVRNLKAVTELCVKTTKNMKYQNLTNLLYTVFGSVITFLFTTYYTNKLDVNNTATQTKFSIYKDSINSEFVKLNKEIEQLKLTKNH